MHACTYAGAHIHAQSPNRKIHKLKNHNFYIKWDLSLWLKKIAPTHREIRTQQANRKFFKKWTKDLNTQFTQKETQKALKHLERRSTSLIIKEMQIRTILRYHFSPIRLAKIQIHSTGMDVGKDLSYTLLMGVDVSITLYGEQFNKIYQNYKCLYLLLRQFYFWKFMLQMCK